MKLGEVCRIVGGGTPSKKISSYYEGDIPWATVRDMNCRVLAKTDLKITQRAVEESATNVIAAGEIVIATHVGLGKVCVLAQDTAINQDLKAIIPIGDTCRGYLYFWFVSIADRIIASGKGATVKGVTVDFVKNLELPLPPLPIQRKIAAELDLICELKRKAEEVVEKFGQLVKSKFVEMFGAGGYVDCELIDVTHFIDYRGKTPTKSLSGIPLITAKNVRKNGFSVEPREYMPEDMFESWMTRGFPVSGDVLFTTEAPLGFVCRIPKDYKRFAVGQRIVTMQPDAKRLDSVYLEEVLRSDEFQRKLIQKSSGSTVTGIRSKLLEKLTIPLPPLALQREFAAFVARVEKLEAAAKARVEKFDLLYRAKLQEYFA